MAIHRLGLKATPPTVKGDWRCYITNVIKEMNVAGAHQKSSMTDHRGMARVWAPILTWELSQVRPRHVFCVGRRAHGFVNWLVSQRLIPRIRPKVVNHYSARSGDARIIAGIVDVVDENLPRLQPVYDPTTERASELATGAAKKYRSALRKLAE